MHAGNALRRILFCVVFATTVMFSQNVFSQRQPVQYDALKRAPVEVGRDIRGGCPDGSFQDNNRCLKCARDENFAQDIKYCVRCSNYDTYIGSGRCQKN